MGSLCWARRHRSENLRPMPGIGGADVVGREAELATIGTFLESVRTGAAALVMEGEAGIGKTTLWDSGVARAGGMGHIVLRVRAAPAETTLPFTGLTELLDPV